MKKVITFLGLLALAPLAQAVPDKPVSLPIDAYIVKEVGSPDSLMVKNRGLRVQPASLTKILTSIIAIESGRLNEEVTIPEEATLVEPSKAGFKTGEKIRLVDLVKAAMVASSNDAAFAIGIHLGGSVERFAAIMNAKALLLGMRGSNFTNPAGYDRGAYVGHYSTAEDLLKLTEYAIRNPIFNSIARLENTYIVELETDRGFILDNHNKLLDRYPYAVGIKTGFTRNAGPCLIARAQKDGKDLLLVMLNAKNRWNIAEDMFEKAFVMTEPEPEIVEALDAPEPISKGSTNGSSGKSKKAKATSPKKRSAATKGSKSKPQAAKKPSRSKGKSGKTADRKADPKSSGKGKGLGDKAVASSRR